MALHAKIYDLGRKMLMVDFKRLAMLKHVGCRLDPEHIRKLDVLAERNNLNRSLVLRAFWKRGWRTMRRSGGRSSPRIRSS